MACRSACSPDAQGVPMSPRSNPWSGADLRRAADLRRQGLTLKEIARQLGRTWKAVQTVLWEMRLTRPRQFGRCKRHVLRLHAQGLSQSAIARRLKVPRTTVQSWCARLGLTPHPTTQEERRKRVQAFRRNHDGLWLTDLRHAKGRVEKMLGGVA